MKTRKIPVSLADTTAPSVSKLIQANGFSFFQDGERTLLSVQFPGCKPRTYEKGELSDLAEVIERAPAVGSSPAAVLDRSVVWDAEGNLTGKLSDEKRTRSISIPVEQVVEVAELLCLLDSRWESFEDQLVKLEKGE